MIQPESDSSWGDWGMEDFCPEGSFAKGFQLKVESDCGAFCDDTALNGIKLFCESSSGTDMGEVRSSIGLYGDWQTPILCHGMEQPVAIMRGIQFCAYRSKGLKQGLHQKFITSDKLQFCLYNQL